MKSFNPGNQKWIAIAVAIAGASSAQALTLSTTKYWSVADSVSSSANYTSSVSDTFDDISQIYFDQFDTSLGTLNSVSISYTAPRVYTSASANFRDDDWANETAGYQSVWGSVSGSISGLGGYTMYKSYGTRSDSCAGSVSLTSGSSCSTSIGGAYSYGSNVYYNNITTASVLSLFTGSGLIIGNFDLGGTLYTNETDGDDGYVNSRYGSASANGYMTISYDYTAPPSPVPVPAAAWLFGSAMVGLATIGRRRATMSA